MTQIDLCAAARTFPFANEHVNIRNEPNLTYSIIESVHRKCVQINYSRQINLLSLRFIVCVFRCDIPPYDCEKKPTYDLTYWWSGFVIDLECFIKWFNAYLLARTHTHMHTQSMRFHRWFDRQLWLEIDWNGKIRNNNKTFKYFPFPVTTNKDIAHKISNPFRKKFLYNAYDFRHSKSLLKKTLTMRIYFLIVSEKRRKFRAFGCGNKVQVLNIIFGMNKGRERENAPPYQIHTRLVNTATLAMVKHVHSVRCIISHPCNKLHHVQTGASELRKKNTQPKMSVRKKQTKKHINKYLFYLMRVVRECVDFVHLMLEFPEVSTSMRERKKRITTENTAQTNRWNNNNNKCAGRKTSERKCLSFLVKICYVHFFLVHWEKENNVNEWREKKHIISIWNKVFHFSSVFSVVVGVWLGKYSHSATHKGTVELKCVVRVV